jgi:hypothetical protein
VNLTADLFVVHALIEIAKNDSSCALSLTPTNTEDVNQRGETVPIYSEMKTYDALICIWTLSSAFMLDESEMCLHISSLKEQ